MTTLCVLGEQALLEPLLNLWHLGAEPSYGERVGFAIVLSSGIQRPPTISSPMRKQYYFRPSPGGLLAWDVDRLVELSRTFTVRAVPLDEIQELDDALFGADEAPTWRSFAAHCRLVQEADVRYPIIRAADGAVMDGMHRVSKALIEGRDTIDAVQFDTDPEPDHVGRRPDELPYDRPRNER